jgi:catechol 2,3-dioxygenase-like lactoylglutathione lyase family enzyme
MNGSRIVDAIADSVADAQATALHCVGVELASTDPEKLARFYVDALTFSYVKATEDGNELKLGDCVLRLRQARGRPMPPDSRSHDRWFRHLAVVVREMSRAHAHVGKFSSATVSVRPETLPAWNEASGGIEAFYLRDPEGHPLELIHFPAGKGRTQWQRPGNELFQGVDHTAIVVKSAMVSLAFYHDLAGLTETAVAHNYGREQERLSALEDANLHATSLGNAAKRAPSIELLEYVEPLDGRVMPDDTSPGDIWWSASILTGESPSDRSSPTDARNASPSREIVDPDGYRVVLL